MEKGSVEDGYGNLYESGAKWLPLISHAPASRFQMVQGQNFIHTGAWTKGRYPNLASLFNSFDTRKMMR